MVLGVVVGVGVAARGGTAVGGVGVSGVRGGVGVRWGTWRSEPSSQSSIITHISLRSVRNASWKAITWKGLQEVCKRG